jgi:catechol 2,3-dioxygenase-like lactoylglutathione lyase family enzyme
VNQVTAGKSRSMIGHLQTTVIDCPDPAGLAHFYAEVLGMWVDRKDDDWVSIRDDSGAPGISFQRAPDLQPPQWPDPARPQQFHLDIEVDDVEVAEPKVLALGARRLDGEGGDERSGFRVYADPAGHPFCLVW